MAVYVSPRPTREERNTVSGFTSRQSTKRQEGSLEADITLARQGARFEGRSGIARIRAGQRINTTPGQYVLIETKVPTITGTRTEEVLAVDVGLGTNNLQVIDTGVSFEAARRAVRQPQAESQAFASIRGDLSGSAEAGRSITRTHSVFAGVEQRGNAAELGTPGKTVIPAQGFVNPFRRKRVSVKSGTKEDATVDTQTKETGYRTPQQQANAARNTYAAGSAQLNRQLRYLKSLED